MDSNDCPPWIDPGSAFRLVVKVEKYVADGEYGEVEMREQQHDLWLDRNCQYSPVQFHEDMSSKIYWGSSQTLSVWVLDQETGSEWKIRRDEHFDQMIKDRWTEGLAVLAVEVVRMDGSDNARSGGCKGGCVYDVTNATQGVPSVVPDDIEGCADTCSSPPPIIEQPVPVDRSTLTIMDGPDDDGLAKQLVDEDKVYEAMGFMEADAAGEEAAEEVPIPAMSAQMQAEMNEAAVNVDDIVDEEPLHEWNRDNPDLSVGICYPNMKEFRLAVRQHAIVKEFEFHIEHSDKQRYRVNCAVLGCPWYIRARTQHDGSVRIQFNEGEYTCASTQRVVSKMASISWVAERAIPLLKKNPTMGPKEVKDELLYKYNIDIPYQTVYNGRQRAAEKLFGKWDDSFDWLYRFKAEIELRSPGSVVEVDTITDPKDGKIRFSKFFCAFRASIDGFKYGCRPYINVDSTALNGLWNGHMPAALALDGHNWMFPVAFGFFDSETKDNWVWFMQQLRKAIGPMDNLAICTDACKGLESAVRIIFPQAEMRECFRHLMENMKKYFTGEVYGKNMWPAARAYSRHKFKYFFDKVLEASPEVQKWLTEHHPFLWARSKFSPNIKCDYINNNLAESWNAWIKEHKDLPVHCMADAIREKIMVLFAKRRRISKALPPGILPAVIHQLNAASRGLGHLKVSKGHPNQAEVTEVYKYEEVRRHVVYLPEKACTCRQWQVTGQPCPHALAVITSTRNPNMGQYVDQYYSVQKLQAAYEGIIPNITDRSQWPEVNKGFKMYPPCQKKREPGRIRKNRIKSARETCGRATRQVRCPNCLEYGHRAGSYKCSLTGTKKRKRTKKKTTKVGRKKAKDGAGDAPTPRTRAAVAREAAEQARREAHEAELKAAAAAAREEADSILEVMALEIVPPEPPTHSTPTAARRSLFPVEQGLIEVQPAGHQGPKKMTPKKKKLATKVLKKKGKEPK